VNGSGIPNRFSLDGTVAAGITSGSRVEEKGKGA
jgi:hypothetical protein